MTLVPYSTRYAAEAIVSTVDGLAAGAGAQALRAGGCAVDAAIAAAAVLAVTHQHQCGLGDDLLALVHRPGDLRLWALNASGRAGSGADPQRLRDGGHDQMPAAGDPACAPVPGCVDGWVALHGRFGRLPLETLLEPARGYAVDGFAASESLAAAAELIGGVPEADDYTTGGPLMAGQVIRRPGVARALAAIALESRRGFYEGEFGQALLELSGGEYSSAGLVRSQAEWVEPLKLDAFGRRVWSLPPNSQGYLLLRSAAIASGLQLPEPEHPGWAHLLIEASREAEGDRDSVWHEASDGRSLIAAERIAELRERISSRRAGSGVPAAVPGGTVSICVVDGDRAPGAARRTRSPPWRSRGSAVIAQPSSVRRPAA